MWHGNFKAVNVCYCAACEHYEMTSGSGSSITIMVTKLTINLIIDEGEML